MQARRNTVRVVFGRKGSGKSYWIKGQVRGLPRLLVWDFLAEYAGAECDRPLGGTRTVYSASGLLDLARTTGNIGRVVVQAPREDFGTVARFARRAGNLTLVVDEVQLYCSPAGAHPELLELLRIGRHARVNLYLAARRPAEVHRDVTAQADELVAFRTTEPRDLEYFARLCGDGFARTLATLGQWKSARWTG